MAVSSALKKEEALPAALSVPRVRFRPQQKLVVLSSLLSEPAVTPYGSSVHILEKIWVGSLSQLSSVAKASATGHSGGGGGDGLGYSATNDTVLLLLPSSSVKLCAYYTLHKAPYHPSLYPSVLLMVSVQLEPTAASSVPVNGAPPERIVPSEHSVVQLYTPAFQLESPSVTVTTLIA